MKPVRRKIAKWERGQGNAGYFYEYRYTLVCGHTQSEYSNRNPPPKTTQCNVCTHTANGIDDLANGKYDYIPVAERVPLHASKAEGFLQIGDHFNAAAHAREVLKLGAEGWIGTPPYVRAQEVLKALGIQ
jgi:hypothetical protein